MEDCLNRKGVTDVGMQANGRRAWGAGIALAVIGVAALLAGCGGASQAGSATYQRSSGGSSPAGSGVAGAPGGSATGGSDQPSSQQSQPLLVKSLAVSMTAHDTRATATALQSWIMSTDPKAISSGMNYSQDGASYDVSMSFNVEASLYPAVEQYLAGYAEGHGGRLVNLQESVQDVTNDYVNNQSRLSNLRSEQKRLQTLMGQAGSLGDVLTIEQRLTEVEGQIEQIQTHLAMLAGQTSYYLVQIQLSPVGGAITPPQAWNPGQVFGQAWGAAIVFGQWLLTLLIWLAVFGLYALPAFAAYWLARRLLAWRRARASTARAS